MQKHVFGQEFYASEVAVGRQFCTRSQQRSNVQQHDDQ